jgi:hypothetical protein
MNRFTRFSVAAAVAIVTAISAPTAYGYHDLSSPDATRTAAPQTVEPADGDGFEWGDAGIGAAVTLALLSLCGGTLALAGRSRRRRGVVARST